VGKSDKQLKKWEILSETDVSPSKWYPILKHTVILPDGTVVNDYYTSALGKLSMVLPILENSEIVMVRQYKHGIKDIMIELPAGLQQENKSMAATAVAELEEETGIKTEISNLVSLGNISNFPSKSYLITYGFLAKDLKFNSTQNLDITEEIEVLTFPPKEVINMIKTGEIWVADTVSLIMKAFLLYPELFK